MHESKETRKKIRVLAMRIVMHIHTIFRERVSSGVTTFCLLRVLSTNTPLPFPSLAAQRTPRRNELSVGPIIASHSIHISISRRPVCHREPPLTHVRTDRRAYVFSRISSSQSRTFARDIE